VPDSIEVQITHSSNCLSGEQAWCRSCRWQTDNNPWLDSTEHAFGRQVPSESMASMAYHGVFNLDEQGAEPWSVNRTEGNNWGGGRMAKAGGRE
jgi:hypothetical protein